MTRSTFFQHGPPLSGTDSFSVLLTHDSYDILLDMQPKGVLLVGILLLVLAADDPPTIHGYKDFLLGTSFQQLQATYIFKALRNRQYQLEGTERLLIGDQERAFSLRVGVNGDTVESVSLDTAIMYATGSIGPPIGSPEAIDSLRQCFDDLLLVLADKYLSLPFIQTADDFPRRITGGLTLQEKRAVWTDPNSNSLTLLQIDKVEQRPGSFSQILSLEIVYALPAQTTEVSEL